ncbi:MAG: KEOPS complex subunit Pcc1 [Candidatus Hydrothermarchaeales archaeon]
MLVKIRLEFGYADESKADKISRLLELDNRIAPRSLKLATIRDGGKIITTFEHERLNTIQATIEDLLFSEKLIEGVVNYAGHKSHQK